MFDPHFSCFTIEEHPAAGVWWSGTTVFAYRWWERIADYRWARIKERQRWRMWVVSDFGINPRQAQRATPLCEHNLFFVQMTKTSRTFSGSRRQTYKLQRAHAKKMKRGGLVEFVLKVPVTMDRFSNLRWQEADRHSWRQSKLHQRIPPALMVIIIIMMMMSFKCVKYVFFFFQETGL